MQIRATLETPLPYVLPLQPQKSWAVLLGFDDAETAVDTSFQNTKTSLVFKIRQEKMGLVVLNFTMLNRSSAQIIVELDSLVSSRSCFVLKKGGKNEHQKSSLTKAAS
jgi:hypothetical protein